MALQKNLYNLIQGIKYVPHFYRADPHGEYLNPSKNDFLYPVPATYSKYDFTSDLSRNKFSQAQTVDKIVSSGYFTVPTGDAVTAIISDKKHTSWMGLDDIISQIHERHELYKKNTYSIELAKCAAITVFLVHKAKYYVPSSKAYYSLNKNLQDLYQQQREEKISLWKDISLLRQSLPEKAQAYLTSYRKISILENCSGDSL